MALGRYLVFECLNPASASGIPFEGPPSPKEEVHSPKLHGPCAVRGLLKLHRVEASNVWRFLGQKLFPQRTLDPETLNVGCLDPLGMVGRLIDR